MRATNDSSTGASRGGTGIIVSGGDRERLFRSARRHSRLVRGLKVVLPALAVACIGFYSAALIVSAGLKSRDLAVGKITVDPTNLTMADPRYSGFGKDGSEYRVHAKSAVTDLAMAAPIRLEVIDGEIRQPNGVVTRLSADRGTYDQKKDLLELYDRIDVDATNGMKARLTRATVFAKESRVVSPEPVLAETETGMVRANSMVLDTKARKAEFRDAVEVTLRANAGPASLKAGEVTAARRGENVLGIDPGSREPLLVTADRLDVDDTVKSAVFRDSVVARQGEARLETPELDVQYEGQAGLEDAATPGTKQPADEQSTRLKTIRASGGVVMTNKSDRAESETLHYDADLEQITLAGNVVMTQQPERRISAEIVLLDQKADTALLTGDVMVTQGRNKMRGSRLAIDRKAGTAKLASPPLANRPAGRITTTFYQSETTRRAPRGETGGGDAGTLGALGTSFKTDPNAPVEVEAVSLDVNDMRHTAIYAGGVVARQGEFVIRTEEMTAHYNGETGLLATAAPRSSPHGKSRAGGPGGSELKRIEARRGVVVTGSDGQQATGEWATFDVAANTIVMGGNVTVSQGRQIVRANEGKRLVIDLGSGITRFEAEPGAGAAAGGPKVSGAFATSATPAASASNAKGVNPSRCPPGAVCKSGRLEAIFYPGQIREKAKAKVEQSPPAARNAAQIAAEAARARRKPGASSWGATTSSPARP
jgi:lipopolysaccharide export system protein LptA